MKAPASRQARTPISSSLLAASRREVSRSDTARLPPAARETLATICLRVRGSEVEDGALGEGPEGSFRLSGTELVRGPARTVEQGLLDACRRSQEVPTSAAAPREHRLT